MATKLVLNSSYEFAIDSYNRYTNIDDAGRISSHASIMLSRSEQYAEAEAASRVVISDLKIYENNVLIYHLPNQNARIVSINENLNDGKIIVNVQITFNMTVDAQE